MMRVKDISLAYNNLVIFTATDINQLRNSYKEQNHGLFTYYMLKGMGGEADKDNNKNISLDELQSYIKDNVSRELISYEGKKTNLEYYIITCNYKGVEKKLNHREKVNQIFKKSGKTPLMIAATLPNFKDAIKMSQILIKEGADVNKKDIYGANVLFYVGYYDYEKRTFIENSGYRFVCSSILCGIYVSTN